MFRQMRRKQVRQLLLKIVSQNPKNLGFISKKVWEFLKNVFFPKWSHGQEECTFEKHFQKFRVKNRFFCLPSDIFLKSFSFFCTKNLETERVLVNLTTVVNL